MTENAIRGRVDAYRATRPDGERTMVCAHPDEWARVSVALHGVAGVDVRVSPLCKAGELVVFPHLDDAVLLTPGPIDLGLDRAPAELPRCACGCGCTALREKPSYLCTRCGMLGCRNSGRPTWS